MANDFEFICHGEPWLLNGFLIETKGIDEDGCHAIAELHRQKQLYINVMKVCEPFEITKLHDLYKKIANTEYKLQDAWGFVRDSNWHRHWRVPHCKCEVGLNRMSYPHHTFYEDGCPVHGTIEGANNYLIDEMLIDDGVIVELIISAYRKTKEYLDSLIKKFKRNN